MTKLPRAFHPYLVALFPTLVLYSRNLHAVNASEALWPVALALGAALVVWGVLRICRLDAPRAALIVSAALILFFSFGLGVKLATRLRIGGDQLVRERVTLGLEALAMLSVVGFVLRKPDLARSLTGPVNASAMALAGLSLAGVASQAWGDSRPRPPVVAPPIVPKVSAGSR